MILYAIATLAVGLLAGWILSGFQAHRASWWRENW